MNLRLHDREFEPFLTSEAIGQAVRAIANRINADYLHRKPTLLVVLNGAFVFAADLARHLDAACDIVFTRLQSYQGMKSRGEVRELLALPDFSGKDVIIIEDIVDTGRTLAWLHARISEEASSCRTAALLVKPEANQTTYQADYYGFEIQNQFVVGYGLDYDGLGRGLPAIYVEVDA